LTGFLKYKLDYLLIILLSFPILFLKLGSFSLRLWDESIYATNSIEMMERGEWIVPYFNGEMDYWNTKPPMINWLQILSMKIFGINEFAIRFPSALAALATLIIVYWFIKKHFNIFTGFVASMVLLTSVGFVTFHGARTGDTDVLLTFFITITNLLTLDLIISKEKIKSKLILISISIALAFLTKSVAAFLFLPAILIYFIIYEKQFLVRLLKNKILWFSIAGCLMIVFGFIMLRNHQQPGYLNLIFQSDLGRVGSTIENHNEPFNFYLDNLVLHRYSYWIIFVMSSFILLFTKDENENRRKVLLFISILSLFYFTLISFSVTKLAWYDIPLFPILAVNIALLFHLTLERIQLNFKKSIIAFVIVFFIPYKHVFGLSQTNHYGVFETENEVKERYLKLNFEKLVNSEFNTIVIYHNDYDRALKFYKKRFEDSGKKLIITNQFEMTPKSIIIVEEEELSKVMLFFMDYNKFNNERFENLHIIKSE
jgi:4-amino-4-deoxy-L-arabinose transferase-like glycosyltransferase